MSAVKTKLKTRPAISLTIPQENNSTIWNSLPKLLGVFLLIYIAIVVIAYGLNAFIIHASLQPITPRDIDKHNLMVASHQYGFYSIEILWPLVIIEFMYILAIKKNIRNFMTKSMKKQFLWITGLFTFMLGAIATLAVYSYAGISWMTGTMVWLSICYEAIMTLLVCFLVYWITGITEKRLLDKSRAKK